MSSLPTRLSAPARHLDLRPGTVEQLNILTGLKSDEDVQLIRVLGCVGILELAVREGQRGLGQRPAAFGRPGLDVGDHAGILAIRAFVQADPVLAVLADYRAARIVEPRPAEKITDARFFAALAAVAGHINVRCSWRVLL